MGDADWLGRIAAIRAPSRTPQFCDSRARPRASHLGARSRVRARRDDRLTNRAIRQRIPVTERRYESSKLLDVPTCLSKQAETPSAVALNSVSSSFESALVRVGSARHPTSALTRR
jgi:hypothetical protein